MVPSYKYTDKYTLRNILIILSILILAYIYCLIYAPSIENSLPGTIPAKFAKMHTSCSMTCKTKQCKKHIKITRGDKYFISLPEHEQIHIKSCVVTFWSLSHLAMYFILTYLVPSFYIELFFIGLVFEIYEYYKFKCHDINDIFFNTTGILLGKYFSPY